MVICETLFGKIKEVSSDKLSLRPAVYAIIIKNNKIVLMKTKNTDKYFFPGGGVELGETLKDALKREVIEETGLTIEIGDLFYFNENFFYYDPKDLSFQCYSFCYICKPLSLDIIKDNIIDDWESEKPRWVKLSDLSPADFQGFAKDVFRQIKASFRESEY